MSTDNASPEHHYIIGWGELLAFGCDAPPDAPCRNACTRDACREEGCHCDDPQLEPLNYCNVEEWISGDLVDNTPGNFRLPVVTEWAGDGYRWRPAS